MTTELKPRLVVDACVLSAASTKDAPFSTYSRKALEAISALDFRVAVTEPILTEWKNHASGWSIQWRAAMVRKRKIVPVNPYVLRDIRNKIIVLEPEALRAVALKDVHLLEAALQADNSVLSCDDKVRGIFCMLAQSDPLLSKIVWVNPVNQHDKWVRWLDEGCPADQEIKLIAYLSAAAAVGSQQI